MSKNNPQRPVTVEDLAFQTGTGAMGERPFLLCDECFAQSSADAGDYWNAPAGFVFQHCGQPMRLVRKEVRFVDVKLSKKT